ncbi:dTDP-4-dehydrorhamnose 3,5-epimerase family protein [Actinokineospora cianjurensis]|uniref:dTDP-4-dehydrorhamnose 3,5-epimerase n=1 Tax=Actinokineospora cianjurensis TaxID=585224 RepID=A0A421AV47_9PSEU|nr:dTDP-4-dehydrorhamnose 3,5-epimerase family protein [Actinokineospora cianjurensis]RLK53965.1 dTDP-4-dehydrorhamnose 3,5-epimerase [Actinokineospora cianjurensis]
MKVVETALPGVFRVRPDVIVDERGGFFESLRTSEFERITGAVFAPRQINYSVSRRNTVRGIHSVSIPPGQAKYVTCVRGALRDFAVDLRIGSPTFGDHVVTLLDPASSWGVYIPEGVGHGFVTLADDTCICYALSTEHVPGTQIDINPFDSELALPWGCVEPPLISAKDARAPSLADARSAGVLAEWMAPSPDAG